MDWILGILSKVNFGSLVTFKDIAYLVVGLALGILFGIAIYWLPLGQFQNEVKALKDLACRRFSRGDSLVVVLGCELCSSDGSWSRGFSEGDILKVKHDEGVSWFHTDRGYIRSRVLHVYAESNSSVIYMATSSHFR